MASKTGAAKKSAPKGKPAASKAQTVAKALKQTPATAVRKIRRNVHFFRPKTRQLPKQPKYPRVSNVALN